MAMYATLTSCQVAALLTLGREEMMYIAVRGQAALSPAAASLRQGRGDRHQLSPTLRRLAARHHACMPPTKPRGRSERPRGSGHTGSLRPCLRCGSTASKGSIAVRTGIASACGQRAREQVGTGG